MMDLTSFLYILLGVLLSQLFITLLNIFKPELVAQQLVTLLTRLLNNDAQANNISNIMGFKLIELGVNVIKAHPDNEVIAQKISIIESVLNKERFLE